MTPEALREIMEQVGWSNKKLADVLCVNESTIRYWRTGRRVPPAAIASWMEELGRLHAERPPPDVVFEDAE